MSDFERFSNDSLDPPVSGFLHRPDTPSGALVLTHGAGGNAQMPLLAALAEAFASAGFAVLRCDLPFRQVRRFGPPRPPDAARDRAGLKNALIAIREIAADRIFLGGQSYGGRQASMLLAEEGQKQVPVRLPPFDRSLRAGSRLERRSASASPFIARNDNYKEDDSQAEHELADGLLLLSYPLHPPGKPEQLRTQHLPNLRVPTLFVEGTRDPFGSIEEIEAARKLIPAKTDVLIVEGAGHDLGFKGKVRREELPGTVLAKFRGFFHL